MYEVRVYNSIGKLVRVVTTQDLEKRSKAFINSFFSARDKKRIRQFKSEVMGGATGVSHISVHANDSFDLG